MRLELTSAAEAELDEAVAYYDAESPGLGDRFQSEVERATERMRAHPHAWPRLSSRSRRCRLSHFPYGLIYQQRDDLILVLAVMQLHREPGYWRDRE